MESFLVDLYVGCIHFDPSEKLVGRQGVFIFKQFRHFRIAITEYCSLYKVFCTDLLYNTKCNVFAPRYCTPLTAKCATQTQRFRPKTDTVFKNLGFGNNLQQYLYILTTTKIFVQLSTQKSNIKFAYYSTSICIFAHPHLFLSFARLFHLFIFKPFSLSCILFTLYSLHHVFSSSCILFNLYSQRYSSLP